MFGTYQQSCRIIKELADYLIERQRLSTDPHEISRYDASITALGTAHELILMEEAKDRQRYLTMMNGEPPENAPFDPRSIIPQ